MRSALTLIDAGIVGNQILDSDFFGNHDPDEGGNAGIGLAIKDGSGEGNVVRGNRSFNNADNGIELGRFASPVTLERNWSFGNGVNRWNIADFQSNGDGFHLGGGNPVPAAAHILRNNAAWDNAGSGFSSSGNAGPMQLTHNTAYRNAIEGFHLPDVVAGLVRDNAAAANTDAPATVGPTAAMRGNSWQGAAPSFRSTDPSAAEGARRRRQPAVGRLPRHTGRRRRHDVRLTVIIPFVDVVDGKPLTTTS